MTRGWPLPFALLVASAPAAAELKSATANGFVSESKVTVPASPAEAYAAIGRIGAWWSPSHSYSGKAANLKLEPRAGGCFCETLDGGGSVEHLRVAYAVPGKALRLTGGLGPLQSEGVNGSLTWSLKPVPGGTEITQTYVVGGYIRTGIASFAGPVDAMLTEQLSRLKTTLSSSRD